MRLRRLDDKWAVRGLWGIAGLSMLNLLAVYHQKRTGTFVDPRDMLVESPAQQLRAKRQEEEQLARELSK
jgi:hypothetical protein